MNHALPGWAIETAGVDDLLAAREAHRLGRMQVRWPDVSALRKWAKQQGWKTPWLDFEKAFLARMLGSAEDFAIALRWSGVSIQIPRRDYTLTAKEIAALDAAYAHCEPGGRPDQWGLLVEMLREIRRAVEAGVVVRVEEGVELRDWQSFYNWAHGRYHALEDGSDAWIGHDV